MLRLTDKIGSLQAGREADISVMEVLKGRFELKDNSDNRVVAPELIVPVFCLRAGKRFDADAVILPKPLLADAA